jgi:two-component system nitrogen regulation sensor histidine kinase NtrY
MEAIVAVKDNGAGIPEDQLEHIFIPFYSSRKQGTGVGLSFSQHVMRLHQGRIHVRSLPGKGSEFQLVFQTKGR